MKKHVYILTLLTLLTIHLFTYSQGCLPEGITFSYQEQIDNFQTNYPGCTEIEGSVYINANINNLNGLIVIKSIGEYLGIDDAEYLTSLNGLDSLKHIGGDLKIWANVSLVDLEGLNALTSIGGGLLAWSTVNLKNFNGLGSLKSIGEGVRIEYNSKLESLQGFNSLDTIGWGVTILSNYKLKSLSGLNNLNHLNGLNIVFNDSLTNLNGLEILKSIRYALRMYENTSLNDISALANTTLDSIMAFQIVSNDSLSTCEIYSICKFLSGFPGIVEIHDNAIGCNSRLEIEDACPMGREELLSIANNIKIFPNPAKKTISIVSANHTKIQQIKIFNQTGVLCFEANNPQIKIDVSSLQPGLYFVEIKTDLRITRIKLIIQ